MRSFCFLLFAALSLAGDVADHFKVALDKGDCHSMRGIDFIYTINLDERPEKFAKCIEQLAPYGILPYRFSAVNGWRLTLDQINDVGVVYESWMDGGKMGTTYLPTGELVHEKVSVPGRTYFCHALARGPIGIVLSHLSILQDAYDSGYETIWVMEDDIQVIRDPHLLSTLVEKLDQEVGKEGWDVLFTDRDTKNQKGEYVPCTSAAWRPNFKPSQPKRFAFSFTVSKEFRRIGARYGAYSMIVRRSGMRKILDFIKTYKIFLPYDLDFFMPNDIQLYTVQEDVISTLPNALSDNGAPNYEK